MEGIKIELKEREEERGERKRVAPPARYYSRSSVYHSYTFRFDKPYRRFRKNCDGILKTKLLELPPDVSAFNAGTSLERWSKKRPRLKSAKKSKERAEEQLEEEEEASKEVEEDSKEDDEDASENVPEDDTDDNVKKLIEDSSKFNPEDFFKSYKPKTKKPARKKTIRFKLSKPQIDETVQVIKVDITSNYSYVDVPEDSSSEGEDYSERFKNIVNGDQSGNTVEQDFTVICKKLTLACRD